MSLFTSDSSHILFLLTLSTYGGAWNFLNFHHYKSMAISEGKVKVHCLGNSLFKT